jgi:acyl carrier protein
MTDLWEELTSVFRMVFDNSQITINEKTTSSDIVGWDSFSHINLISAIEDHFKIEFTQSEAYNFENVGELIATLQKKVKPLIIGNSSGRS